MDGVTYPLIDKSRDEFLASFKYDPLLGLPRFVIVYPDTDVVRIRLYPAPSQFFQFYLRGKFQLTNVTSNDDMSSLPGYYSRFLKFAVARDISMYKGRADAWTPKLEALLQEAQDKMEAASEVNLSITGDRASLLNGSLASEGRYIMPVEDLPIFTYFNRQRFTQFGSMDCSQLVWYC